MIKSRVADTAETSNTLLDVILDDGDEVIDCIEKAFLQNNIKEANLIEAAGRLRNVKIATTKTGTLTQREYAQSCLIKSVSGKFTKIRADEYMGDFHISVAKDEIHAVSGVLLRGIADGDVRITFKVIADMPIGAIVTPEGVKEVIVANEKPQEEPVQQKPKKPFIVS